MSKREVIDEIMRINNSARPGFLASFSLEDLQDYLSHLQSALTPRPLASLLAGQAAGFDGGHAPEGESSEDGGLLYAQGTMLF